MNIFVLNKNPKLAARDLCNKHLSKMALGSAQMLYTAHWVLDKQVDNPNAYKKTHYNHPCNVWVRASKANYLWLVTHALTICEEYSSAYLKQHKCHQHLIWLQNNVPKNIPDVGLTNFALCFYKNKPDLHKQCLVVNDPVSSYRNFYKMDKSKFAKWTHGRIKPDWWDEKI